MQWGGRGSRGWTAGLGGCGLVLGAGLGMACGPEPDPRVCADEVAGERADWETEVPVATPECNDLPFAPPIGLCVEHEGGTTDERELDVEIAGEIVELGTGVPPARCAGPNMSGMLFDEQGELAAPPEDVRWIRLDVDGERWVLALMAAHDTAPLSVGDEVTAWIEWEIAPFFARYRFDLRDAEGEPLWWFADDSGFEPVASPPACQPVRLGEPVCNSTDVCWRMQHHAVKIGGTALAPHEQAVIDGLRFTNGSSWRSYDAACSDAPSGWRMLAATREGS